MDSSDVDTHWSKSCNDFSHVMTEQYPQLMNQCTVYEF